MAALDWLRRNLWLPLGALYLTALWLHGQNQWDGGYRKGKAEGDHALAELRLAQTEQALQVANTNHAQLLLQIERADQAEGQLLQVQQQVARLQTQLQERIPHVTTVYRPAPAAEPVAIPRCVFTAGWLRDFNLALGGADLPGTAQGPGARIAAATTWAAPVLRRNYWKAASPLPTSWRSPRTTDAGPRATWPNSSPCKPCTRTDSTWM